MENNFFMNLLGIRVDEVTKEQALQKAGEFLNSINQYKIFTPNPEMVVKAQKDQYFKQVLNSGDLNLCDGFGLWLATRFHSPSVIPSEPRGDEGSLSLTTTIMDRDPSLLRRGFGMTKKIERIVGVDFMLDVCRLTAEQGKRVYLLGSGDDEVVGKTCEALQKQFPNLKISGYNKGPVLQECFGCHSRQSGNPDNCRLDPHCDGNDKVIVDEINKSQAEILFVAFGMGKQEKWIYENLAKMPNVKVAMGVGGSFDFISGKINRAPLFLRESGLEWVYRLVQEPKRIGRIFNATIKFTFLILKMKLWSI